MKVKINRQMIREFRAGRGWTQEKLAEESGLHTRTIQRIENSGVASIQSLDTLAKALQLEPLSLRCIETELPVEGRRTSPGYNEQQPDVSNTIRSKDRQFARELAKDAERVDSWLAYQWIGWPILFIGGFLVIDVLLMTQANLNRTVIFNVFFPGVIIGSLLMLTGRFFIHLADKAAREKEILARLLVANKNSVNPEFRFKQN